MALFPGAMVVPPVLPKDMSESGVRSLTVKRYDHSMIEHGGKPFTSGRSDGCKKKEGNRHPHTTLARGTPGRKLSIEDFIQILLTDGPRIPTVGGDDVR